MAKSYNFFGDYNLSAVIYPEGFERSEKVPSHAIILPPFDIQYKNKQRYIQQPKLQEQE